MRFKVEPFTAELFAEVAPLMISHWGEIALFKDTVPLDPDYDAYAQAQAAGRLRFFTCRDEAGALQGYAVFFVINHPHYKTTLFAVQDVLFVQPELRHAGSGAKLILWCDQQLKAEGVGVVSQHVKVDHDFGPMLERMGYVLADKIYLRRL